MRIRKFLFFQTVLGLINIVSFFLVGCAPKDKNSNKSLFVGILSFDSSFLDLKKTAEESDLGSSDAFEVTSISPQIVFEDSSFTIEGKNLNSVTKEQLFGGEIFKFVKLTSVSESKIIVSVVFCPSSHLFILSSGNNETNSKISIPCLGNYRNSVLPLFYELGVGIQPFIPQFAENSLVVLQTMGTLEFISNPPLPKGIQMNAETGEIFGIPLETTGNEIRSFQMIARVKANQNLKIESYLTMIVVSGEEKFNRTCRPIAETSTCFGPSPHVCNNRSGCFKSLLSCLMDSKCGFSE
ncbi:hypothetical protein NUH30_05480 [Leptospira sp. 85282-16]|uniref:hypothetical protein n=1 Tax=Leptospira sp. 85282-16 TaxID=2971256 RepID=UPI0021C1CF53|nr:hypothetical protein [Leptospira sp. 85282-16]MCT8333115.1 hypothetical protein [Leptospira sp. 85282-16]